MIRVSKKIEYSVVFLSYLQKKKGQMISLTEAANILSLPNRFLSQLANELKKGKIIGSKEGKLGGYFLEKGFEKVSLYDLLEIFGENKRIVECMHEDNKCLRQEQCKIRGFWSKLEKSFVIQLKKIKLGEI